MKIGVTLDIPHEVYLFYLKVTQHMDNCTIQDIMVDALQRYAAMISDEIALQRLQRDSAWDNKKDTPS